MKRLSWYFAALLLGSGAVDGATQTFKFTVTAGKHGCADAPVCVPLSLPNELAKVAVAIVPNQKGVAGGQLTAPGITTEAIAPTGKKLVRRDLHIIVAALKPGERKTIELEITDEPQPMNPPTGFHWQHKMGFFAELTYGNRPVLRYMCEPIDESSKERRTETYKVFHHLYNPAGTQVVTNPGVTGLYPHHRGMMMGFNRITYGNGKKADTWHCTGKAHQRHQEFLNEEQGPLLGRHRALVTWHGQEGEVIAKEEREFTAYHVPDGQLIEFASRLRTAVGPLELDGDPQHAGFQFRAHRDVAAKTAKQTYYLRRDGQGKLGETRNWPGDKSQTNLPWNAMSFVLDGNRYTAAYLDQPNNPRPTYHSERDYGRFGCYFVHELTEMTPLLLNYRIWLQDGEMMVDDVQRHSSNFTAPPSVKVN